MPPVHGRRVVGDDAYDKAVREEVGGVHTFGVRVRGAIPENGPTNIAKRVTEHGPLVVAGAQFQDEKGKVGDSISIDSLRNILTENPTFFDSLYEAELARPDGARPDALSIFYEVERGIKGAGRQDVLAEIRQMLDEKRPAAAAQADLNKARLEQSARQQRRMEENNKLVDADRIQALAEREENLASIRENENSETSQLTTTSASVETQLKGIADEQGVDPNPDARGVVGSVPMKPDGPVHVETQQPGPRGPGSPKAPAEGSEGSKGTETDTEETDETDFESMTKADLEDHIGKKEMANVKGTGAEGAVLKADLVKHAKKLAKKGA